MVFTESQDLPETAESDLWPLTKVLVCWFQVRHWRPWCKELEKLRRQVGRHFLVSLGVLSCLSLYADLVKGKNDLNKLNDCICIGMII